MRFLKHSRFTSPSSLRLLDFAYLAVLIPLFLVIKAPMLVYAIMVFSLLLFRKKPTGVTLLLTALVGFLALFLSLYGSFNLSGLSRLKLFVELLIYLLVIAISLQRITRQINFYLIISPVLFMALSLFFFQSLSMLIYVVVEAFVLLWLILAHRMQGSLKESLRMTAMYFASSLPWVVLLFIFFPRISFEHATYGFEGEVVHRMGHDGTMHLDHKAFLVPSERIVMEVGFEGEVPASNQLYFRGSMLYNDQKDHWEPLSETRMRTQKPDHTLSDDLIIYKVTLYPTQKRWLYLIDLPYEAPQGASMDADFITTLPNNIEETQHYQATSALRYRHGKRVDRTILKASLQFDPQRNPRSLALAQDLQTSYPDPKSRMEAIMQIFKSQNLTYSLEPEPLDLNHSVDSFLLDTKRGYCVHFASSFVLFSRMAGIPARIVTGYKGDRKNSVNHYLIIKEKNAHAWAEVWVDEEWKRVEATAFAARIDTQTRQSGDQNYLDDEKDTLSKQVNLYLMYVKYQVETWILDYSYFRQMQLLDRAENNPAFVLKFVGAVLLMLLLSVGAYIYFRRPLCSDRLLCALRPLLKVLQKEGLVREDGETMHAFFCRCKEVHPRSKEIAMIDTLYERIRYGADRSKRSQMLFEKALKEFLRSS